MTSSALDIYAILGTGVAQIGMVVADLEEAVAAHRAAGPWSIWTYDRSVVPTLRCAGGDDFAFRIALNAGDPQLELIEPLDDRGPYAEALAEAGGALHHLGFLSTDVAATTVAMEAAGVSVLLSGSGHGADGTGAFTYYDTREALGYLTEAIERPSRRREPDAVIAAPPAEERR